MITELKAVVANGLSGVWALHNAEHHINGFMDYATISSEAVTAAMASVENKQLFTVYNGVAVIPVKGTLIAGAPAWAEIFGVIGYEVLANRIIAADKSKDVKKIFLHFDSPGGTVAGLEDAVDIIKAIKTPIKAVVGGMAASAAYALAASTNEIIAGDNSILGSIGTKWTAYNYYNMLQKDKIEVFTITSGDNKALGGITDEPTPEYVQRLKENFGKLVNESAEWFAGVVANGRGIEKQIVLDKFVYSGLKGGIVRGQEAIKLNLADRLGNIRGELSKLASNRTASPRRVYARIPSNGGLNVELTKILEMVNTADGFDPNELEAAIKENAVTAVEAENKRLLGLVGVESEKEISNVLDMAANGKKYHDSLLAEIKTLTIKLSSDAETAEQEAELEAKAYATASIDLLESKVDFLKVKVENTYPTKQVAEIEDESPNKAKKNYGGNK